ncbi:MAG TPA: iron-sulfur cluster carrier protein ApbC [Coxiellaceae bacterium]|nr:iron-sulfur cluster carrier protein ApbC [Coxiellaceae bacterium]
MSEIVKNVINQQLSSYQDPYLGTDLVRARVVKKVQVVGKKVTIHLTFGYPIDDIKDKMAQNLTKMLRNVHNIDDIEVNINFRIQPHIAQKGLKHINNVKNIIAIASGKGGVGKSTTAVNIACALVQQGARVGLLDADIYGPNQPHMLGLEGKSLAPPADGQTPIQPIERFGLQTMSIGYLIDMHEPIIWRGPLVSKALQQLIYQTQWDHLDYLIVDMPPGTGDIQLTLAKQVPVSGAVIITTPQDIALLDARKGLEMFHKVNVSVLGIIENMSSYVCLGCGKEAAIFGKAGGERLAKTYGIPLLGQLPLSLAIREAADRGEPFVLTKSGDNLAKTYRDIARQIAANLSLTPVHYASKFPDVVLESSTSL